MRIAILIPVLLLATTLSAQEEMPPPAKDYAGMSTQELTEEINAVTMDSDPCTVRLPMFREAAARRPDIASLVNRARFLEIGCATDRGQFVEANALLSDWDEAPFDLTTGYGLFLAVRAGDGQASLNRLRLAMLEGDETSRNQLSERYVWPALREARLAGLEEEVEELLEQVLREGLIEQFVPALQTSIASGVIEKAAREGDLKLASRLFAHLDMPDSYGRYLGRREYEVLWPQAELRVGPHFEAITSEHRANAVARWEAEPDNLEHLNSAAHAIYMDGDFGAAVAFVDAATGRSDLAETLAEDEGWALNIKAYALDALSRRDEADAVFDMLAAVDPDDKPWVVSFVINRALRLVGQGRWDEGLAAANLAGDVAEYNGNTYANTLVASARICALHALDRPSEYGDDLLFLEDWQDEVPLQLISALQCIGRESDAADLLLATLRDETLRDGVLEDLQPEAFDLFYTRSILPKPRDLREKYPEIREEFLQHAREIPAEFYPAASLLR